jgi:uncharacterized protein (DUF488 family)
LNKRKQNPEYEFIPYQFGCYSYSANADIFAMSKQNIIEETEHKIIKKDTTDYFRTLKLEDQTLIKEVLQLYGKMSTQTLIKHTYIQFPYFAINSTIANTILSKEQLQKVNESKPKTGDTILFTIGYEGVSVENYLNKLIQNDVKLLIDVRRNPISMKYGFSKNTLKRHCESINIKYLHIPEVGIASEQRQVLNSQKDYDLLFLNYKKSTLNETEKQQEEILNLLQQHKRVALTCFEANICQCHRKPLAEAVTQISSVKFETKHI